MTFPPAIRLKHILNKQSFIRLHFRLTTPSIHVLVSGVLANQRPYQHLIPPGAQSLTCAFELPFGTKRLILHKYQSETQLLKSTRRTESSNFINRKQCHDFSWIKHNRNQKLDRGKECSKLLATRV